MDNKQFTSLAHSIAGLLACQSVVLQFLVNDNILNKAEIENTLETLLVKFDKQHPNSHGTVIINQIKNSLNNVPPTAPSSSPEKHQKPRPDWLKGIIEGGQK